MALDMLKCHIALGSSALLVVIMSGCDPLPRTEIIVEIDTDLDVPDDLNGITVEVMGPNYDVKEESDAIPSVDHLPATLGVVHTGGSLGPYEITAIGRRGGMGRVERTASLYFIPERTLVLPLRLLYDCLYETCPQGETCTEEGCASIDVDSSELDPWAGN